MVDRSLFLSSDGWSYDGVHPVPSEEITAIMLDLVDLKPNEKVLEIGTGSGYQTACWAETGAEVFTIDRDPWKRAEDGDGHQYAWPQSFDNIFQLFGDGRKGWPYPEEFDCIILTCGVQEIPPPLISQLKENGRLIAPIGDAAGQELRKYVKQDGKLALDRIAAGTRFVMCEEPR